MKRLKKEAEKQMNKTIPKVVSVPHKPPRGEKSWFTFYCPSCGEQVERCESESKCCECKKPIEWEKDEIIERHFFKKNKDLSSQIKALPGSRFGRELQVTPRYTGEKEVK